MSISLEDLHGTEAGMQLQRCMNFDNNATANLESINQNIDRRFDALIVYLKDMESRRFSGLEGCIGAVEGSIRGVEGSVRGVEGALGERISAVEGSVAALQTNSNVRVSLMHTEVTHIRTVVDRPQQQPELLAAPPHQNPQPQFQGFMAHPVPQAPPPPPPAPPVGPYPGAMPYGYQGY
ncbi:hypothetical protein K474DRAFT_1705865 [Panus rudis PR-1116 ss-1]|nr:hypothetical protein K474DRAFT_1705865 [Panus rudis PR-1116 ss-1]